MENKKRDLRDVKDILPMALSVVDMRFKRTGDRLSVGDIARYGIELLYASELEILRMQQERVVFNVEVISEKT